MIGADGLKWVGEQILAIKMARDDQKVIMKNIKIKISSLSDTLRTSIMQYDQNRKKNPEQQDKVTTLDNFNESLIEAHDAMKKIESRNCCIRNMYAQTDLETLKECDDLIKTAIDLIRAEKDIIELAIAKQDQHQRMSQYKIINQSINHKEAQDFWSLQIGMSNVNEKVEVVIQKFYAAEFTKLEKSKEIKKPYAMIKLAEYLDKDGDGEIDLKEFGEFYENVWAKKEKVEEIVKEILEEQDQPLKNNNQIMASILSECHLVHLLTKFMSMGLNSRSFLNLDLQCLMKIVSLENAVKIYDAIKTHNDSLKKFEDIKSFLISVRDYAYSIRQRYLANPVEWKKGITGVCKLRWCICEAFNGKIYGPYIRDDEISYGFITAWDPDKNYNPLNQYIANFGEPSKYKYNRLLMETYSYWDRDKVYTYQQISPFEEAFVIKRKFDKDDEDYIRPYAHGPTLYRDKNGNQARIYYYQNHEMSLNEFEEKAKEDYMYPKFKKVNYKYS